MANSSQADPYRQWHEESLVLHEIGTYLSQTKHPVEVRLPRALADLALNSWQREGFEEFIAVETSEQHRIRSEAASLALIGLTLSQGFVQDGDEVIFQLDACFVGAAIEAAHEIEARLDVEE
jgi:hypothetical protein